MEDKPLWCRSLGTTSFSLSVTFQTLGGPLGSSLYWSEISLYWIFPPWPSWWIIFPSATKPWTLAEERLGPEYSCRTKILNFLFFVHQKKGPCNQFTLSVAKKYKVTRSLCKTVFMRLEAQYVNFLFLFQIIRRALDRLLWNWRNENIGQRWKSSKGLSLLLVLEPELKCKVAKRSD